MAYFIETWDKPDHQQVRQAYRPAHLVFLETHKNLLLACGAKLEEDGRDAGGGVYIVDVASRAEADAFIQADPFWQANLFEKIRISRWRKAYVAQQCFL